LAATRLESNILITANDTVLKETKNHRYSSK